MTVELAWCFHVAAEMMARFFRSRSQANAGTLLSRGAGARRGAERKREEDQSGTTRLPERIASRAFAQCTPFAYVSGC